MPGPPPEAPRAEPQPPQPAPHVVAGVGAVAFQIRHVGRQKLGHVAGLAGDTHAPHNLRLTGRGRGDLVVQRAVDLHATARNGTPARDRIDARGVAGDHTTLVQDPQADPGGGHAEVNRRGQRGQ